MRSRQMLLVGGALLVLSAADSRANDSQVMAAQSMLKAKQFYFDEPTGVMDDATQGALRRYQIRYGLPVTGEADATTLKALKYGPESVAQNAAAPSRPPLSSAPVASTSEAPRSPSPSYTPPAPRGGFVPPRSESRIASVPSAAAPDPAPIAQGPVVNERRRTAQPPADSENVVEERTYPRADFRRSMQSLVEDDDQPAVVYSAPVYLEEEPVYDERVLAPVHRVRVERSAPRTRIGRFFRRIFSGD